MAVDLSNKTGRYMPRPTFNMTARLPEVLPSASTLCKAPLAYCTPNPVPNLPENNHVHLLDYRGAQLAAFNVSGRDLICLPQAFELFLKQLVGGLHTVYTKLKRLSIVPVVCNVEQVRILRGLGAIQPGVNRCKLIAPQEFDVLYADCTNSSARPGRPSKRLLAGYTPPSTTSVGLPSEPPVKASRLAEWISDSDRWTQSSSLNETNLSHLHLSPNFPTISPVLNPSMLGKFLKLIHPSCLPIGLLDEPKLTDIRMSIDAIARPQLEWSHCHRLVDRLTPTKAASTFPDGEGQLLTGNRLSPIAAVLYANHTPVTEPPVPDDCRGGIENSVYPSRPTVLPPSASKLEEFRSAREMGVELPFSASKLACSDEPLAERRRLSGDYSSCGAGNILQTDKVREHKVTTPLDFNSQQKTLSDNTLSPDWQSYFNLIVEHLAQCYKNDTAATLGNRRSIATVVTASQQTVTTGYPRFHTDDDPVQRGNEACLVQVNGKTSDQVTE